MTLDDTKIPRHQAAQPIDELRRKYAFVSTIAARGGIADQKRIDEAILVLAECRARMRHTVHGPDQIPGGRATILMGDPIGNVSVCSLSESGEVIAAIVRRVMPETLDDEARGRLGTAILAERTKMDGTGPRGIFDPAWSRKFEIDLGRGGIEECAVIETDMDLSHRTRHSARSIETSTKFLANSIIQPLAKGLAGDEKAEAERRMFRYACGVFRQAEIRRDAAARRALLQALDPDVLRILRSQGNYRMDFVNFLTGHLRSDLQSDEETRARRARNRVQAIRSYPALAPVLSRGVASLGDGDFHSDRSPDLNEIGDIVDSGRPLIPVLCSSFGLTKGHVRALQGITWQKAGRWVSYRPKAFLKAVSQIDHNHLPKSRQGFAEFQVATCIAETLQRQGKPLSVSLAEIGGRFAQIVDALDGQPAEGIADFSDYLRHKLIAPSLYQAARAEGMAEDDAVKIALEARHVMPLKDKPVRAIAQASARWHRALARHERDLVTEDQDARWKPLLGEIDLGGGMIAVELCSDAALRREGTLQNHCVGGYAEQVLTNGSLIFSIRKGHTILSTLELSLGYDGKVSELQNQARDNTGPGKEARRAGRSIASTVRAVPNAERDAYRTALAEEWHRLGSGRHDWRRKITRAAGYDIGDPDGVARAWQHLSPYLVKQDRALGQAAYGQKCLAQVREGARRREQTWTRLLADEPLF